MPDPIDINTIVGLVQKLGLGQAAFNWDNVRACKHAGKDEVITIDTSYDPCYLDENKRARLAAREALTHLGNGDKIVTMKEFYDDVLVKLKEKGITSHKYYSDVLAIVEDAIDHDQANDPFITLGNDNWSTTIHVSKKPSRGLFGLW